MIPRVRPGGDDDSSDSFSDPFTERIFPESASRTQKPRAPNRRGVAPAEYDEIVQETEALAQREYSELVLQEVPLLQENRALVEEELGTSGDRPGGDWRLDPNELSESEIEEGILKLRLKIRIIQRENSALQKAVAGEASGKSDGRVRLPRQGK
jgi:hypothetical protein